MPVSPTTSTSPVLNAPAADLPVEIGAFSYDDRAVLLPALVATLTQTGCFILSRRNISPTRVEFAFEVPLRLAFDLYSCLIATGLELTREAHRELTGLCTLRKFNPRPSDFGRVVRVSLEVQFVDEADEGPMAVCGTA